MFNVNTIGKIIKHQEQNTLRLKTLGFTDNETTEVISIASFLVESLMANNLQPNKVTLEAVNLLQAELKLAIQGKL